MRVRNPLTLPFPLRTAVLSVGIFAAILTVIFGLLLLGAFIEFGGFWAILVFLATTLGVSASFMVGSDGYTDPEKTEANTEWHTVYADTPIFIGSDIVWREDIKRRLVPCRSYHSREYQLSDGRWEYRLP